MIIEHMLFFAIGALSVIIAEIFLREINVSNRQYVGKVKREELKAGSITASVHLASTEIIQYWTQFLRKIFRLNKYPWIWIIFALLLMVVWHIPYVFDYAFTHSMAHVLQHISFVAVGAAIFVTIRILGESFNLFLLLSLIGMMGFAGLIFLILDSQVYQVYSIKSHHDAGIYMIITSILLLLVITPIYLIRRTIFHLKAKG
ncbi:MAG TPA: DUF1404 family protein [Nitrososphaeraceae archaeon]|nr:DUF1404 family protein [Nitrososphaeraceae archaeon]